MTPALRIQNLSKKFRIHHEARQRHQFFVHAAASAAGRLGRRALSKAGLAKPVESGWEDFWALNDVSFDVQPGEVVGIIGRNGAGKSTLLKILSQITEPTKGRIEINGRVASLLEVGTGFHPELTGRENVFLNGAILGMTRAEIRRKFDEIVAFAEIDRFIDTPVKRYSSGMQLRLAFAVAAHLEPEILIIDEVLAVGDAEFQKKCIGKMRDVASQGRTIAFVSHNMAAVRKLCPRAILLKDGRLVSFGDTEDLISDYLKKQPSDGVATLDLSDGAEFKCAMSIRLRFLDQGGISRAIFRIGEIWRIVLDFQIFKPLRHVIAAVGIVRLDGTPLITFWSKPKDLAPGIYSVEFNVDLPLSACDLQFAVGLSTHENNLDYREHLGRVEISEIATGDQPFRATNGVLLGKQEVEIQPSDLRIPQLSGCDHPSIRDS